MKIHEGIGKKVWSFICLLLLVFVTGCGSLTLSHETVNTHILKDSTGAEVAVPIHPSRIVSMGVSTDDIIISLTGTDKIVAISNLPPNQEEEAKKIKGRVTYSTESVLSFQPDLVIVPNWMSADFIKELRELHLPVYVYAYPNTIEGTEKLIGDLGVVVNEPHKAKALQENIAARVARLEAFAKQLPPDKVKTAIYYNSLGVLGGEGTNFDNFCHIINIKNGARMGGLKQHERGSKELIVKINPDIIFLPSDAYDKDQYRAAKKEELYNDPSLQNVKAIQNKSVYVIDARRFLSYSQFAINAMEQMAQLAYGYEI